MQCAQPVFLECGRMRRHDAKRGRTQVRSAISHYPHSNQGYIPRTLPTTWDILDAVVRKHQFSIQWAGFPTRQYSHGHYTHSSCPPPQSKVSSSKIRKSEGLVAHTFTADPCASSYTWVSCYIYIDFLSKLMWRAVLQPLDPLFCHSQAELLELGPYSFNE